MLGLAAVDALHVFANHWPAVFPDDRLHVGDAAINPCVLKMDEPFLAGRSVNQAALVRTVNIGAALVHHNFFFIRAEQIFRTEHGLPAGFYASSRSKYVYYLKFPCGWGYPYKRIQHLR